MKTAAIHSHKGGVGKTTISLMLALHAARKGRKVCVLDFDFLGCGMSALNKWDTLGKKRLQHFFVADEPHKFDIGDLLTTYKAKPEVKRKVGTKFSLLLNLGSGLKVGRDYAELSEDMESIVANESLYREVQAKTKILLDALEEKRFDLVIIDCHPGMGFVSETVTVLADVNVYVATQNRSDCFALLKAINAKGLDGRKAFLALNRTEGNIVDLKSFQQRFRRDSVVGSAAKTLLGQLSNLGKKERQFEVLAERESLRAWFNIGSEGMEPYSGWQRDVQAFCSKLLRFIETNGGV